MKKTAIIFVLALLVSSVTAQDATKSINAGIVNGKAVSLPKPVYPETAKAAGINALIGVNVIIDEGGNVVSAEADVNDLRERWDVDGTKLEPLPADPSLRASAEEAARKAKFSPTMVNGPAVRVSGKIVYNFVSENSDRVAMVQSGPRMTPDGAVTGKVLNGQAISLPKPEYPAAGKAVRAEGTVSIRVMIDEQGNVVSASAVSGHPLLRSASESAARLAKFAPMRLSDVPVKVSGILTYNFVLPKVEEK